jgi:protein phosphatase
VTIFRGVDANLPGITLQRPYEQSSIELDTLSDYDARQVREGIEADSLGDARHTVENLAANTDSAAGDTSDADRTGDATGGAPSGSGQSGSAGGSDCAAGTSASDADCG